VNLSVVHLIFRDAYSFGKASRRGRMIIFMGASGSAAIER